MTYETVAEEHMEELFSEDNAGFTRNIKSRYAELKKTFKEKFSREQIIRSFAGFSLDSLSTTVFLKYGIGEEGNPIGRALMEAVGPNLPLIDLIYTYPAIYGGALVCDHLAEKYSNDEILGKVNGFLGTKSFADTCIAIASFFKYMIGTINLSASIDASLPEPYNALGYVAAALLTVPYLATLKPVKKYLAGYDGSEYDDTLNAIKETRE